MKSAGQGCTFLSSATSSSTSTFIEMDDEFGDDIDFNDVFIPTETPRSRPGNASTSEPAEQSNVQQPKPQALPSRSGPSSILVNSRQKGNPILNHIRALPWEWADIPADYVVGNTTCALFLSLKYHRLHPEYVYSRIRQLAGKYNLRILLTLVDIDNHQEPLKELSKTSLINNLTLILCWSSQEAGRYLELFKSYENASPSSIRARESTKFHDRMQDFITTPRTINKTDALSLVSNFGSIRKAVNARPEEIGMVPGWGEKKVQQWCGTVREPFRVRKAAKAGIGARRSLGRRGSTTGDDVNTDGAEDSPRPPTRPIPIGTVPSKGSRGTPDATTTQKRPAASLELWESGDDDEDEEEAYLMAAAAESVQKTAKPAITSQQTLARRKDDELDSGIAAALAKLREKEG
jgi:DNA excision repair protein ERCC-1